MQSQGSLNVEEGDRRGSLKEMWYEKYQPAIASFEDRR